MKLSRIFLCVVMFCIIAGAANDLFADSATNDQTIYGLKLRFGGRYDDVRKCVASPTGTKGGIAADISAFTEIPAGNGTVIHIDLPVMRPILFAFAFRMLQFEPTVTLKFSDKSDGNVRWTGGPMLGVSMHYGPDYHSESSGPGRTASFYAMGPIIGGYAGLDFRNPGKNFNFQLGVSPYVAPLLGIGDPQNHRGVVIGGLIDGLFCFK